MPVSDLVEKLDTTIQVHFEGQRGWHGFFADLFDVQLSDDDRRVPIPGVPGAEAIANAELGLTLFETGGLFSPRGEQEGFAVLYGARVLDSETEIDARFDFGPGMTIERRLESSDTLVDGMIGGRYAGGFTPHWLYILRADASAGGTDFTWNALAGVGDSFGETGRYSLLAGYRHLDIEPTPTPSTWR